VAKKKTTGCESTPTHALSYLPLKGLDITGEGSCRSSRRHKGGGKRVSREGRGALAERGIKFFCGETAFKKNTQNCLL